MRLYAFSVLDKKAEYFSTPFFTRSLGEAIRGFGDEARNPDSQLAKHPNDFELYHVGYFSQETGELEQIPIMGYGSAYEHGRVEQLEISDRYQALMNGKGPSEADIQLPSDSEVIQ